MAASTWKQPVSPLPGGAARPNLADILSRVENNTPAVPAQACKLTAREQQILQLLAEGRTATAISGQLYISRATVRNHTQHILAKLGLHSKLEAVAYAYRHGLIKPLLQA
ncbi:MAG: response regulator transcription factor [Betaproteobacteria bacterium]|nr:response regulator transcription factor [Betaproteobacteria bacterium]MBI3054208.1 response regulator transcription factor [Betaproteobacteria bacterium]